MKKLSILVVDDAAFTRDLIKNGLRKVFPTFVLEEAVNGKQARNRLLKGGIDLVLCDWEMPEMNGDELLAWMRANSDSQNVPFVMVTSRGDKEHVVKALELGADNYLVKPFTTEKLAETTAKVLAQSQGIPIQQLVESSNSNIDGGIVNPSADVLLGAQAGKREAGGLSGALPIADATNAVAAPQPSKLYKVDAKEVAQLRFGSMALPCLIREVGLQQVKVVIQRARGLPTILDPTVFDFVVPGIDAEANINGYVHRLEARDPSQESEFVNVTINYVDDDTEKLEQLTQLIRAVCRI